MKLPSNLKIKEIKLHSACYESLPCQHKVMVIGDIDHESVEFNTQRPIPSPLILKHLGSSLSKEDIDHLEETAGTYLNIIAENEISDQSLQFLKELEWIDPFEIHLSFGARDLDDKNRKRLEDINRQLIRFHDTGIKDHENEISERFEIINQSLDYYMNQCIEKGYAGLEIYKDSFADRKRMYSLLSQLKSQISDPIYTLVQYRDTVSIQLAAMDSRAAPNDLLFTMPWEKLMIQEVNR